MSLQLKPDTSVDSIESKKDLIKRTYCKGATDDELELFVQVCKKTGLDPFLKQIYAVKYGGQMTFQTSIDGLRLIADRSGKYCPGRESTYTYDKDGKLVSATSYVKKKTCDGMWHEVSATAFNSEYNKGVNLWKAMPHVMLAKCAEAVALRKAFPAEMAALYAAEEMPVEEEEAPPKKYNEDILWSQLSMRCVDIEQNSGDLQAYVEGLLAKSDKSRGEFLQQCNTDFERFSDYFRKWIVKKYAKPEKSIVVEDVIDSPSAI